MLWIEDQYDLDLVETLSRGLSLTTTLSKFLISTGIEDLAKAENFLNPKLAHFADPFDIPGMIEAVNRICQALQKKEKTSKCNCNGIRNHHLKKLTPARHD